MIKYTIGSIRKKKSTAKKKASPSNKTYLFNFKQGGWNSVVAKSKKEAISTAKKKYGSDVNEKTFRIRTEKDEAILMRTFY